MAEATAQLDLQNWIDQEVTRLAPSRNHKMSQLFGYSIMDLLFLVYSLVLGILFLLSLNPILLFEFLFLLVIFIRKRLVKEIYQIGEKGINVPYTWLTRTLLSWNQIVGISKEIVIERETDQSFDGIRINLDTRKLRFNYTGMIDQSILLTSKTYSSEDLLLFYHSLESLYSNNRVIPNSAAQRLQDLVNTSWNTKNRRLMLNVIDNLSLNIIQIYVLFKLIDLIFDMPLMILITVIILYSSIVLIYFINELPHSIIGFRGHELGSILYDDPEAMTTFRFIYCSLPFKVNLLYCEPLYEVEGNAYFGEFNQIHPQTNELGELTYGIAQITGNHTKSIGCNVQFKFEGEDQKYQVEIKW
ncbi:MAG: hypothetical protein OEZ01_09875 [Candidatus Heimdallarchaeota archaeon]|nr:hypothetical protein [Candidatus Heimdallarchaeota archaeon]MDH5646305.1 hypothetical protein [Candidatus Heimdallarchaeota archaeon]